MIMMMTTRMMVLIIMVNDDGNNGNNDEKIRLMAEMMIMKLKLSNANFTQYTYVYSPLR